MIITSKLTNEQLLTAIYKAAAEYEKLLDKEFLIIGKNKKSDYFWFECYFEKKNFMHLLGIKSATLTADEFFEKCAAHNIDEKIELKIQDCTPSRNHNRATINEKCSCCADILRIEDAKYMNIGSKDKINQFVDFSYAYGSTATLGFKESYNKSCFPITLIPRNIDEFTSQKYRVNFVFEKASGCELYSEPLVEIKKGILSEHYDVFPDELKRKIRRETIEEE